MNVFDIRLANLVFGCSQTLLKLHYMLIFLKFGGNVLNFIFIFNCPSVYLHKVCIFIFTIALTLDFPVL